VTVGQEVKASPPDERDDEAVAQQCETPRRERGPATTAIGGGNASKGRETSRGTGTLTRTRKGQGSSTGETTMNPRVVSRCNSADRIDEEKAGEVA